MKAKIPVILFLLWGILFALAAGEKGDSLDLQEKLHFLWVATLIETRAAPLAHQAVVASLRERKTLGDHLALLSLERFDMTRKEKEEILSLLENLFPESPVLFHAALVCAQKEKSFAFTSLALRLAKTGEEKLAAFEELFALLKERSFFQEGALVLARMYREFEDQSTQKTRTLLMPLLSSLSPESFSSSSRLAFAEFLLSLGFLEEAEKFAATLEDAFLLKARLFARKGDLKALEKLLEGREENEDTLFFWAVLAERRGERDRAIAFYTRLLSRFPQSPYVQRALANLASLYRVQGRKGEYLKTLERAVQFFPQNGSSLWNLFWALYEERDFKRAQSVLKDLAKLPAWRNQALFWSFKTTRDASYLATIIEENRLDYYYVRACEILGPASPFSLSPPEPPKVSWAKYRFFSSLGLLKNAEIELLHLLAQNPKNEALLLEASRFFARRGLYRKSLNLAFRLFPEKGKIPEFAGKSYYPLAFFKDVQELSASQNPPLDPYLVLALVHAESAFDPEAVSPAGAIGLAQVIPSTASWVIEKGWVKLKENPGNVEAILRSPRENLAVGIAYLAHLFRRFEGDLVLALCGYNAGPGRAERWKNELPPDRDAFIESIPFEETRNYVKKVLTNYFAYTILYRGISSPQGTS